MIQEELKSLDDIDDVLVVQKIERKDLSSEVSTTKSIRATQCLCFKSGCDCERNVLIEEQEAIIKRQLQMLQADERGKRALLCETAALKERQESKIELLRNRQHALKIEKERARKIASLPPPLPKSIKFLLKENGNDPKLNNSDVQMPDELTTASIKPIEISARKTENKENIIDPEEFESKQKMQEEWDMKAKKRYNEALKKDRQKEEYSKIMKQIQNAELLNRQEMAKNVSSDKKGMPCLLSDKFQAAKKQVNMEDAAEKIFKKTGIKEHVIEDVEGYQDHYEEKYKQIDSVYEAKMIDCIPSFVKANYDYLLEDESKFLGGKNFSGLDDSSSDILNQAYIETPPGADKLHGREIHHAISQLDRVRSNLETEYEQNIKPLLVAAIEVPKKESKDQAVGTESIKISAEDKAIETDEHLKNELTSPSPTATFNFTNAGVMAFKRRPRLPILSPPVHLPDMHQRDVYYAVPFVSESKDRTELWSPSTYCSLPTKHGIPTLSNEFKSTACDICVAEMEKDKMENNFVQESTSNSVLINKEKYNLAASLGKTSLSELSQQLAEKHLKEKSTKNSFQKKNNDESFDNSYSHSHTNIKTTSPAFEKEVIGKSNVGFFNETDKSESNSLPVKNILPDKDKKYHSSLVIEKLSKQEVVDKPSEIEKEAIKNEKLQDNIYSRIKDIELHKSPNEYSEYEFEAKRIQAIHQVLSRKFPQFSINNDKTEEKNNNEELTQLVFPESDNFIVKPYVYHELSTIQEVDSALTASNLQLSQSKLSNSFETKGEKNVSSKEKDLSQFSEKLKMLSLLDPPDTKIAEIAKNIHFIPESEKKVNPNLEISQTVFTNSSGNKSTSSNEYLATPSFATGSCSSVSMSTPSLPLSSSSQSIPSVKSQQNKNIQSYIISGFNNDIEVQAISEDEAFHSKQDKNNTMNTIISGYISDLDVPQKFSTDLSIPDQEEREKHSIVSGYISDLEMPHMSVSNEHNLAQDKNDSMYHLKLSDSIRDAYQTPNSNILCIRNNIHSIISRNVNTPWDENDSSKFFPMSPCSDVSSPRICNDIIYSKLNFDDLKRLAIQISPKKNFRPMTPHSNISSPSELNGTSKKDLKNCKAGNLKLMAPHSATSQTTEFIDHALKRDYKNDNVECFEPITPHSNISSCNSLTACKFEREQISSPCKIPNVAFIKDSQNDNSAGDFKALTLYSNVSSPSTGLIFPLNDECKNYVNTSGSFKALSSNSNITSPSDGNANVSFKSVAISDENSFKKTKDNLSSKNSNIKPIILRLDIATDSLTLNTFENKPSETKHVSQLNCNLTLKTLLEPTSRNLAIQGSIAESTSETSGNIKYSNRSKNRIEKRQNRMHLKTSKKYALACTSDFFIPSINEELTSSDESISKGLTDFFAPDNVVSQPEKILDSKITISDSVKENAENLKEITEKEKFVAESSTSDKEMSRKTEEKMIMKLKESHKNKVQLENLGNFKQLSSHLQGLSSNSSSSTENLSMISRSKVVYQSTPVKSISELLQEPGILEEPDLTLVNTLLSCKGDTTEINKDPLTSNQTKEPAYEEKNCSTENEWKSPISLNLQFVGSPDTPSMLSFLQHEMSCKQSGNESGLVQSSDANISVLQNLQENNTPAIKKVKRSLFQKTSYKERTKRLWNNLEEVKKKNLAEERKKEIQLNRKKAKEFAMKLTPKQRQN